ncbi:MAG: hypothetical protein J6A75_10315 [Lachnospiraceae bacterium]|nr:hypothetical protein [Lachnospiraceae bacterium]
MKYLCGEASESIFTKKLDEEVHKARTQKEWRVEYMTLFMRDQENIEKGIERGIELERIQAIKRMMEKGFSKYDIFDWGYTEEEYKKAEQE